MGIGSLTGTLTRQYQLRDIVVALGGLPAGAPLEQVQNALDLTHTAHTGLARRLFDVDSAGCTIDSELHRACRDGRSDALLLVWAALLIADHRTAQVVERFLTTDDGRLRPERFDAARVRDELGRRGVGSAQKAASNLLRYFETAGIVEAARSGATIVGVDRMLTTTHAVPGVVTLARERVAQLEGIEVPVIDAVEFALDRRLNHWLLLTADQFRAAALPGGITPTPTHAPGSRSDHDPATPRDRDETPTWRGFTPKDDSASIHRFGFGVAVGVGVLVSWARGEALSAVRGG